MSRLSAKLIMYVTRIPNTNAFARAKFRRPVMAMAARFETSSGRPALSFNKNVKNVLEALDIRPFVR